MAYFGDASTYLSSGNKSVLATGESSASNFLSGDTSASTGSSFSTGGMFTAAKMGLNLASSIMRYSAAKKEAKAAQAYQKYHNSMVQLGASTQQNNVTLNEIMYNQSSADQALQIKTGEIKASGTIEASAASAGVKGNSVYLSMLDIKRNAAQAEYKRAQGFKNQMLSYDSQRTNIAMSGVLNMDNSFIPQPSAASYILSGLFGG